MAATVNYYPEAASGFSAAVEYAGDGTADIVLVVPNPAGVYRIWGMLIRNDAAAGEITARPNGLTTNQLGRLFEVNNVTAALLFPTKTELFLGRTYGEYVFFDATIAAATGAPRRMSGSAEARVTPTTAPTYTWYSQSEWDDSTTPLTSITFHVDNSNEFTAASRIYVQRIG